MFITSGNWRGKHNSVVDDHGPGTSPRTVVIAPQAWSEAPIGLMQKDSTKVKEGRNVEEEEEEEEFIQNRTRAWARFHLPSKSTVHLWICYCCVDSTPCHWKISKWWGGDGLVNNHRPGRLAPRSFAVVVRFRRLQLLSFGVRACPALKKWHTRNWSSRPLSGTPSSVASRPRHTVRHTHPSG